VLFKLEYPVDLLNKRRCRGRVASWLPVVLFCFGGGIADTPCKRRMDEFWTESLKKFRALDPSLTP
jgi:hypothetical protein